MGREEARSDVALVRLEADAAATLPEIEPLAINCDELPPELLGASVQNVGYGVTVAVEPVPPNSEQRWTTEEVVEVLEEELVVDGDGISSVCRGDSGGPSLWTAPSGEVRVIGVVSWGDASCVDRDHFSRVDRSCDFLSQAEIACGDISELGRCDGGSAVFCEGGWRRELDCTLASSTCGDIGGGRYRCLEDSCGDETAEGRCERGVAVWCQDGEVERQSCPARGLECLADEDGRFRCTDPGGCGSLTFVGACEGSDLVWCEDRTVRRRRCGDCGQRCGWSDERSAYDCM